MIADLLAQKRTWKGLVGRGEGNSFEMGFSVGPRMSSDLRICSLATKGVLVSTSPFRHYRIRFSCLTMFVGFRSFGSACWQGAESSRFSCAKGCHPPAQAFVRRVAFGFEGADFLPS